MGFILPREDYDSTEIHYSPAGEGGKFENSGRTHALQMSPLLVAPSSFTGE